MDSNVINNKKVLKSLIFSQILGLVFTSPQGRFDFGLNFPSPPPIPRFDIAPVFKLPKISLPVQFPGQQWKPQMKSPGFLEVLFHGRDRPNFYPQHVEPRNQNNIDSQTNDHPNKNCAVENGIVTESILQTKESSDNINDGLYSTETITTIDPVTDLYETTTADDDPLNRMGLPPALVASIVG